ncbi:uncharacterized protein LOC117112694 [Anneissia japonica]|uniref:uncharacterized protein LOC117112694 n=1 Tax=Anneissia japonica TaxID=1529436 RepID=UPI00142562FC|nr:uncharacterized protein LOC117112694 [Anneissia japonica]
MSTEMSQATVTWNDPTVSDNVDTGLSATCTPSPGSSFNAGAATNVTCSATDAAKNEGSCMFVVGVVGNCNSSSIPGYLIAVVVILCLIILLMSPALIFFCRFYYSQKNRKMEHSTGMNMTDYEVPKKTNAPGDTEYEITLPTIADDDAALPKMESQRKDNSAYEEPHTYMSVDPAYTDLKK